MKNIIILGALAIILSTGNVASAHDIYEDVWDGTATTTIAVAHNHPEITNGDPNKVVNGWGLTNEQSKIVAGGTIIKDAKGIVWNDACPKWQPKCVDLTGTEYYISSMKSLARQLLANGFWVKFPVFKAWLDSVK